MARTARFGDLIEIPLLNDQCAYAIYTHRHQTFGWVIHVFQGRFDHPLDPLEIVALPPRFAMLFPVNTATKRGLVRFVGHVEVPAALKLFPTFKSTNALQEKAKCWFLWDGERDWRVDMLSEDEKRLPPNEYLSFDLVQERIASDWRPEDDPRI